jgi:hypothetical protein
VEPLNGGESAVIGLKVPTTKGVEMAQIAERVSDIATLEMSASIPASRASSGSYNLAIAAGLLAIAFALIAAQLIIVGNNPDVIEAAARNAASGIIAP